MPLLAGYVTAKSSNSHSKVSSIYNLAFAAGNTIGPTLAGYLYSQGGLMLVVIAFAIMIAGSAPLLYFCDPTTSEISSFSSDASFNQASSISSSSTSAASSFESSESEASVKTPPTSFAVETSIELTPNIIFSDPTVNQSAISNMHDNMADIIPSGDAQTNSDPLTPRSPAESYFRVPITPSTPADSTISDSNCRFTPGQSDLHPAIDDLETIDFEEGELTRTSASAASTRRSLMNELTEADDANTV
jgi:hypothetical protein